MFTPVEVIVNEVEAAGSAHRLLLFDFDGTLAEFADDPDTPHLTPTRARLLHDLGRMPGTTVGIVSGRELVNVRRRAMLPAGAFYAGLHGLEIEGPGLAFVHPGALAARDAIASVLGQMRQRTDRLRGVVVEDKRFALTVHWRQADRASQEAARAALAACTAPFVAGRQLRIQPGLDHEDVMPDVAWNKGEAVRVIAAHVAQREGRTAWPLFVGDDLTDEDAFEAIGRDGITVVVGGRPSGARFRLRDPSAVERLLVQLNRSIG
jgi:trehalose 6-phosphate phosphatase